MQVLLMFCSCLSGKGSNVVSRHLTALNPVSLHVSTLLRHMAMSGNVAHINIRLDSSFSQHELGSIMCTFRLDKVSIEPDDIDA